MTPDPEPTCYFWSNTVQKLDDPTPNISSGTSLVVDISFSGLSIVESDIVSQDKSSQKESGGTSRAASPLHIVRSQRGFSKAIYKIVCAALTLIAARRDSNRLPFARNPLAPAGRISADIMEILAKYAEDQEAKRASYVAIKAALQDDPEISEELAIDRLATQSFVLSFIDKPVAVTQEKGCFASDGKVNKRTETALLIDEAATRTLDASLLNTPNSSKLVITGHTRVEQLAQYPDRHGSCYSCITGTN